jgi:hypothetical protein
LKNGLGVWMNTIAKKIAELRVLVGFLGEKGQANWWNSEFFSATATAFLAPIFNRSLFLAQYQGVTAAASKMHAATQASYKPCKVNWRSARLLWRV